MGQALSVPLGYSDPIMAPHAGQEGWKWKTTAWPASFQLIPRPTGFSVALTATATWYVDNDLAPLTTAPSAPAAGDSVWKITKLDGTLVGLLTRSTADGALRWVVRTAQVFSGDLPNVTLNFQSAPWPTSWSGAWSQAVDPVVP